MCPLDALVYWTLGAKTYYILPCVKSVYSAHVFHISLQSEIAVCICTNALFLVVLVSVVTPHSLYVPLQMDTSIFTEGSVLPMPSQQALSNSIGKGGNGTVTYVFYSGREFAVKKVILA